MIRKVTKRLLSWQNKLLTFGGKYILINHVLQSIPIYILSAMNLPKKVIKQLHQIFAKFFWGNTGNTKRKQWWLRKIMCYSKEDGGL